MEIKLLDGTIKKFSGPLTVKEIASTIATSLGKKTIGGKLNGNQLVPADFLIKTDLQLEIITPESPEYEEFLANTFAFAYLIALKKTYPALQFGEINYRPLKKEFSATFLIEPRLGIKDLAHFNPTALMSKDGAKIKVSSIESETELKKILTDPSWSRFQRELADKTWKENHQVQVYEFKTVKLITTAPLLSDFKVVESIFGGLKANHDLKLVDLAGAYWKNDAREVMLQEIYGLVGRNGQELITRIKERQSFLIQSDHRHLNQDLEIFGFDPLIGQGLPLWLPNGTIIKNEIKKYLQAKEWEYDYLPVQTPLIGTVNLYQTSGHWEHYRDDMFQPFKSSLHDQEEFVLRPMNCPHHIAVYKQTSHSYRDLPIRLAEHALQYRYESSGSLTGLERVRAMELTDSHIFVRPDQLQSEFKAIYQLINEVLKTFKIQIDYLSFSVRDPQNKEKYFPDDKMWEIAEKNMEQVLQDLGLVYKKIPGEAAFYGPKLDIQIRTPLGHEVTISTIQLDFLLPRKFNVTYLDQNQKLQNPIMIHRGLIGTYERFIATLLEQTKGALPLWLAPCQVVIIPLGNPESETYGALVRQELKKHQIRTQLDLRDERLAWKIREAQTHKIPYQLVLGEKEYLQQTVTFRRYGKTQTQTVPLTTFLKQLNQEIASKQ